MLLVRYDFSLQKYNFSNELCDYCESYKQCSLEGTETGKYTKSSSSYEAVLRVVF